jgi:site-specific recombinase XerD
MKAYKTSQGNWQLNYSENGVQKTLYLGKRFDSVSADRVARIVTEILDCRDCGNSVRLETLRKVASLPQRIQLSLRRIGLFTTFFDMSLEDLINRFMETKKGTKDKTQRDYKVSCNRLYWYFSRTDLVSKIDKDKIKEFIDCCNEKLAECTMYRSVITYRSIFEIAVKLGILTENPFDGIQEGKRYNEQNMFYVTRELTMNLLKVCNDDLDRLIIVLARFGGLRVPSELEQLRFKDFRNDVITVHEDTKTGWREVPFFGEIREVFNRLSGSPESFVFPRNSVKQWYSWGMLSDVIARAGIEQYPKLFVNMRSSCITDLDALGYSEKTLDAIFGNSAEVRRIHYLQLQKKEAYKKVLADNKAILYNKDLSSNDIQNNVENLLLCKNLLALRDFLVSSFGVGNSPAKQVILSNS